MKKLIVASTAAATLLLSPIVVLANDSIAEIKAMAERAGLKVIETDRQLVIDKPVAPPKTETQQPTQPSTPPKNPTHNENQQETPTKNEQIQLSLGVETKIKNKVPENRLDIAAVYITPGHEPGWKSYRSERITNKVTFKSGKDAPFTIQDKNKVVPIRDGQGTLFVTYQGKTVEFKVEIWGFRKANGVPTSKVSIVNKLVTFEG
jgi:hypothetical protein